MNIIQRANLPILTTPSIWEPFRAMREMMRWNPLAQMEATVDATMATFNPDFEVVETREGYQFRADLPGIKEKDLEINISGNRITVSGHREADKTEESDRYYLHERSYGSFMRSFTLPEGIDGNKAMAELKGGVLNLFVPRNPESLPHKIAVKATR